MNEQQYIKRIFKISRDLASGTINFDCVKKIIEKESIPFPKNLYKYRECNEHSFSALENKQCYFNLPSFWKDTIDSTISFDLQRDLKKLRNEKRLVPTAAYQIIKNYLDSKNLNGVMSFNDFDKLYKTLIPQGINITSEYSFSKFTINVIGINKIHTAVNSALESLLNTNKIRDQHLMLSLTKTYKNDMMWNQYSKDDTGFCIKYNIKKLFKINPHYLINLLPIYYSYKKPISFLDYMDAALDTKNSDKIVNKISQRLFISMLTKKPEWVGEQEWRFICDDKMIDDHLRSFDCAEAIYLGSKINEKDKKILIEISKKNKLKVYQRKLDKVSNEYVYDVL